MPEVTAPLPSRRRGTEKPVLNSRVPKSRTEPCCVGRIAASSVKEKSGKRAGSLLFLSQELPP